MNRLKNTIFVPAHMALVNAPMPVIALELGEKGYWPVNHPSHEELNGRHASEEVLRSAVQASMFGWDTPCAKEALKWFSEAPDDKTS